MFLFIILPCYIESGVSLLQGKFNYFLYFLIVYNAKKQLEYNFN